MPVIGLHDLPLYSSTEGNLESVRFRHIFDTNMNSYYYILELKDLSTNTLYMVMVTEGRVFTKLESERLGNNPKKFNVKKVLIPENGATVISIDNDYNFIITQ